MRAALLEEKVLRVDLLLDIMEGQHLLSRDETSAAPSGPGPAGYEPCVSCWDNMRLGWRECPSCEGSGWVKSRNGAHDPYLPRGSEPVSYSIKNEIGEPAISNGELTDENRERVLRRAWENRKVYPPPVGEHIRLTRVERAARNDIEDSRLRQSLEALQRLIRVAEEHIVRAALRREREGLEWFAARMSTLYYVPGL